MFQLYFNFQLLLNKKRWAKMTVMPVVIHLHVGFGFGVGRHFVFKPTFFRLFETYEVSKFPTFSYGICPTE